MSDDRRLWDRRNFLFEIGRWIEKSSFYFQDRFARGLDRSKNVSDPTAAAY